MPLCFWFFVLAFVYVHFDYIPFFVATVGFLFGESLVVVIGGSTKSHSIPHLNLHFLLLHPNTPIYPLSGAQSLFCVSLIQHPTYTPLPNSNPLLLRSIYIALT